MLVKRSYPRTQNVLLAIQLAGDIVAAFTGLSLGYFVRFRTPLRSFGVLGEDVTYDAYVRLISIGTIFLVVTYAYLKLYDGRLLLRPHRALVIVAKATLFWSAAFLGTSLALKFEPAVSRVFVGVSCITTLLIVAVWRLLFDVSLQQSRLRKRIAQRIVFIGWSRDAEQLATAIHTDGRHPYEVVGYIYTVAIADEAAQRCGCPTIGKFEELASILKREYIDTAIVADLDLSMEKLRQISDLCERYYVQFKIMPSFFRIFVSSLKLDTISGVPVLGIEELRVTSPINSAAKRSIDCVGATVGLLISVPLMLALAILIRRESPGPILYRQVRTGRYGRPFTIYKLRSMQLDAEKTGAQWATAADPRRLRIGAFMRKWNLDELPQFWNVLVGDMSLVGPRPERPELIQKFETEIPHYNPRHAVRPGLTGWAQVNGLRGNTSLSDRITYDIYYIENWNLWFDIQILALTFIKYNNAY